MRVSEDEGALAEARALRDSARGIVRTDLETLRLSLDERPIARRMRDRALTGTAEGLKSGVALIGENRAVLGLTLAGLGAWLFRKPLGAMMQTGGGKARSLWAGFVAAKDRQRHG